MQILFSHTYLKNAAKSFSLNLSFIPNTLSKPNIVKSKKLYINVNLKILFSKAHLLLAKNNFIIQHLTLLHCNTL